MWYVIQTKSCQEEQVAEMIRKQIPKGIYEDCFVIKREWMQKAGNFRETQVQILFPGYLFVTTGTPKEFYYALKEIPELTLLLHSEGDIFLTVSEEEETFLTSIQNPDHIVPLSNVKLNQEGQITEADGAVGRYLHQIIRQRIRKRYVWIEQEFLGKKRKILLGIRLEEDGGEP